MRTWEIELLDLSMVAKVLTGSMYRAYFTLVWLGAANWAVLVQRLWILRMASCVGLQSHRMLFG